jgi:hypothetical protein
MRKEVVIAVLIGLSLGLVITYGFYTAQLSSQTSQSTKKTELEFSTSPTPESQANALLKLTSPEDESVVTAPELTIAGQASANGFVIISLLDQVSTITADEQGKFSTTLTLKPGGNIIVIQATDEGGTTTSLTRTVVLDDPSVTVATGSAAVATPTPTGKVSPTPKVTAKPSLTPKPKQ